MQIVARVSPSGCQVTPVTALPCLRMRNAPHQSLASSVKHTDTSLAAPPMAKRRPQGDQRTQRAARLSLVITWSAMLGGLANSSATIDCAFGVQTLFTVSWTAKAPC